MRNPETIDRATKPPSQFLREIFLERRARNAAYSTRAFARDLGISQTLLSLVLNEKRPLTAKQAARISALLGQSPDESQELLRATLRTLPSKSKKSDGKVRAAFRHLDIEKFKVLSQWYHIALLDLTTIKGFKPNLKWIADTLGISTMEAKDALERLLNLGFLEEVDGTYKKVSEKIYFDTEKSESAVRAFHKQMMQKAQATLDTDPQWNIREISGITIAVNPRKLQLAKKKIQKFQKDMAELLTKGGCEEVYQLNIQLFPLTKIRKGNKQ